MDQIWEQTQKFWFHFLLDVGTFVERLWNVSSLLFWHCAARLLRRVTVTSLPLQRQKNTSGKVASPEKYHGIISPGLTQGVKKQRHIPDPVVFKCCLKWGTGGNFWKHWQLLLLFLYPILASPCKSYPSSLSDDFGANFLSWEVMFLFPAAFADSKSLIQR